MLFLLLAFELADARHHRSPIRHSTIEIPRPLLSDEVNCRYGSRHRSELYKRIKYFRDHPIRHHTIEENKFGKKLGSALRGGGRVFSQVVRGAGKIASDASKEIGKVIDGGMKEASKIVDQTSKTITKGVVKPISKTIKQIEKIFTGTSSSSIYEYPVQIRSIEKGVLENTYSAETLADLIDPIVNDFAIDKELLTKFMNGAKFSASAKTLLNSLGFGQLENKNNRTADLGVARIKVTKSGSVFNVNVKKVYATAQIWADMVIKSSASSLFYSHHSKAQTFRPLREDELQMIYSTMRATIQDDIDKAAKE